MGQKPSDRWTVPLCEAHHVTGQDAQHNIGEMNWWRGHGIDPHATALALYGAWADDDNRAAELIVLYATNQGKVL